ncbi:MAG: tRNA (adenosine(37)-N6)-threonylcarbamoyltransferase complex ATPase subunit type 1 TsaE [Deltaproteobacteria bacterium]|nr:tRNA (adenosine(37)-N6)-threonylcarbamoyltransferase complex ATPase subunit type 1 TsaE [Deltaproteobacteria bacterium]
MVRMLEIVSPTPQETERIGSLVGQMLKEGDVIALAGELGTGKTTLVRGIAQGMGFYRAEVASPSFTLINEYDGPLPLFHIDLYRLEGEKELYEIGYEEYMNGDGVVVIEWADKVPQSIPKESLWIILRYLDAKRREIVMRGQEDRYEKMIEELRRKLYN